MAKIIGMLLGGFILLSGLSFLGNAMGLFDIEFWGVKYEDDHRKVFEQTQSYNHGMIRDIENICLEIERVESQSHKDILKAIIRHRMASFDGVIPPHVRQCTDKL